MKKSHDLSLPEWGPYSKRFFGLSHRADARHGHRFDLTVTPSLYRQTLAVPDVLRNSNYLPWLAAGDLTIYEYRQQLEWKDKIFVDIAFVEITPQLHLVRCRCVNHSDQERSMALHQSLAMELNAQEQVELSPLPGEIWLNAAQQGHVTFATPRLTDGLNFDGVKRGEMRSPLAVDGSFLGKNFGAESGDKLVIPLPRMTQNDETIFIRYRASRAVEIAWQGQKLTLPAAENFTFYELPLAADTTQLELITANAQAVDINGFAIVPPGQTPEVIPLTARRVPHFHSDAPNTVQIQYDGIAQNYGLWWGFDSDFVRHYAVDNFNDVLYYKAAVHQRYLLKYGTEENKDDFLDIVFQPIPLKAGAERLIYTLIANGTPEEIQHQLASVDKSDAALEAYYQRKRPEFITFSDSPWQFSQERMAAVMLTNAVYPIYVANEYIRHHTPGRCWNSLYTWDSGFIGLGFLEFDFQRAEESLSAYLTAPGDEENAFIHHGSPVPVQIYLFHELWNRTGNRDLLTKYYPSLKQYYDFLVGRNPQSGTRRRSREAMLCTWDYFYNSGGWDDYPPQWEVHLKQLKNVLPVVPTAHMIRSAKMLRFAAEALNETSDIAQFDADIAAMTQALQEVSYDAEAGVFSYVIHDDKGNPTGFYRASDGSNYNQGLDGLSPLLAGAVTPEQRQLFWEKLASPAHFWCQAGLSTVDQSASYFRRDGYWNGSVWLPYMYFFWKAALNDGQADFAWRMASTALDVWERETRTGYACYEHFNAETGQGQGWHHFAALSSPAVIFHGAYTAPDRLTCGNDWHCANVQFTADGMTADLSSCGTPGNPSVLLVNLKPKRHYTIEANGQNVPFTERRPGCYEIMVTHRQQLHLAARAH